VDGCTELGFRVQRDSSAAKLAPNVGLEASKIPLGGLRPNKDRHRTHDDKLGVTVNHLPFTVNAFSDLEIFRKIYKGQGPSGPCHSGTFGLRPLLMLSHVGHRPIL